MPRFETFDGAKLSFDVDGPPDGPAVLLLHGYASDAFINWVRPGIVDRLVRAGYRSIALDQRGHGMSDKPHDVEAYADGAMIRDARALLEHLEIERVAVVGFSMGAMTTLRWLLDGDERIRVAVLAGVGANLLAGRQRGDVIADGMLAEDRSTITNPIARSFRDFADLTRADREALAAFQRAERPAFEGFERIDVPVLVLGAVDDPLAGDPSVLASKIAGAQVATAEGSHLNVVNNPRFHDALLTFLDENRGAIERGDL